MAAAATLNPGDEVKPDAIAAATFIKGEAPKEWEKDKVYIIECWATWCGPCIAVIPHVNDLYKKYQEKGLRVIGMNVMEKDLEKVKEFVEKKGDGMSYPVAFVNETVFTKDWFEAAGARGIPHAFVVKNGKLLFSTHPGTLDEATVEGLLEGGEKEAAIIKTQQEEAAKEALANAEEEKKEAERNARFGTFQEEIQPLIQKKDFAAGLELIQKTLKENTKLIAEDQQQLTFMSAMLYTELKKYDEAHKAIDAMVKIAPDSNIAKQADRIKESIDKEKSKADTAAEGEKEAPNE